jgi:triacylglycerol lipase
MQRAVHHVFLIPGFFGFSNLGDVHYFRAVRERLVESFHERGEKVTVHGVATFPTGSLRRRAQRVLTAIHESKCLDDPDTTAVHLIGHSTGGIDGRIVASGTRDLGYDELREKLALKLRTVVCVAAPHYGTPIANFFTTIYGKQLLYFVTLLVFVGLWRRPISAAAGLLGLGYRLADFVGLNETMMKQLTNQLLRDFTPEREAEVRVFLNSILGDVSLMIQLTPESMDVLHGALQPLPGVRLVSYGTVAPKPLTTLLRRTKLRELLTPLGTVLYTTLWTLASQVSEGYAYHPQPAGGAKDLFTGKPLTFALDPTDNDGVVPSLSQIFGEFRGFVKADHLDVIGHYFRGPLEKKDGADWLVSGAHFSAEQFQALWSDVTSVLLGGE